jgi:hypothetical protein
VVEVGYLVSARREDFRLQTVAWFDPGAPGPAGVPGAILRAPLPAAMAARLRRGGEGVPPGWDVEGELPDPAPEGGA